jgi:putative intracellular protease/amidase
MSMRHVAQGGVALLALLVLGMAGFGAWLLALPRDTGNGTPAAVTPAETRAILGGLAPRGAGHGRPIVAVVGINDATEVTDYLTPTGILRRADIADVVLLATEPGPVKLYPVLTVEPDATLAEFDARAPEGADYVIVPAMSRDDDPAVLAWLRSQAGKGATIVAVCAGAKVVAAAGLLEGRRATTHWYYLDELLEREPSIRHVPDRRLVVDRGVATTTGITASLPAMLGLVEAIGGRDKARRVADELGVDSWDASHDSAAFGLTREFATTVLSNRLAFWNRETVGVELRPGIDEVSLALLADAWSRTYRSSVDTFSASAGTVVSRNGVRIVAGREAAASTSGASRPDRLLVRPGPTPTSTLDDTLASIGMRYGDRTAQLVAMQLEYPRQRALP